MKPVHFLGNTKTVLRGFPAEVRAMPSMRRNEEKKPQDETLKRLPWSKRLRACEIITSHFRIPSSRQFRQIFTHTILNVALATPAVVFPQIDPT